MAYSLFSRSKKNKGGSPTSPSSPMTPPSENVSRSGGSPRLGAGELRLDQHSDGPSEQRRLLVETDNVVAFPARGRGSSRVTPMTMDGEAESGSCFIGSNATSSSEDSRPLLAGAFGNVSPSGRSINVDMMGPGTETRRKNTPPLELLEWAPNFAQQRRMLPDNEKKYALHDFPLFFLVIALGSFVLGGWCAIWAGHARCAIMPALAPEHHHTAQHPGHDNQTEHHSATGDAAIIIADCDCDKDKDKEHDETTPAPTPAPVEKAPDEEACASFVQSATLDFRKRLDEAEADLASEKKARLAEQEEATKSQSAQMDDLRRNSQAEVDKAQESARDALEQLRESKVRENLALSAAKTASADAAEAKEELLKAKEEAEVREEGLRTKLEALKVGAPSGDASKVWHNQRPSGGTPEGRYAYVLMAHEMDPERPNHLWGVLSMARQISLLSEHGYPILVLTNMTQFPDGTDISALEALNVKVLRVKDVPPPHGLMDHARWEIAWLKVQIWTLTDYEKLLWLDSDAIIYRSVDHLFESSWMMSQRDDWHCSMTVTDICSGIMLVFPSLTDYQGILDYGALSGTDWSKGDQLVIQKYFDSTDRPIALLPDLEAVFGQCIGKVQTPYILPTRDPVQGLWAMPSFVHKSGGWAEGQVHFYDVCFQPDVSRMLFTINNRNINVCHLNPLSRYWRTSFCEAVSILNIAVPLVSAFCHDDCFVRGVSPNIPGVSDLVCGPIDATAPANWGALAPGQPWEVLNR